MRWWFGGISLTEYITEEKLYIFRLDIEQCNYKGILGNNSKIWGELGNKYEWLFWGAISIMELDWLR